MKTASLLKRLVLLVTVISCLSQSVSAGPLMTPHKYWWQNRLADLMDIVTIGAGVSVTDSKRRFVPPSYGAYVELTSLVTLGYIKHHGNAVELDGRGVGAYSEEYRERWGLGYNRHWQIHQGLGEQYVNYYKDPEVSAGWAERMAVELGYQTDEGALVPAKQFVHRDTTPQHGSPRGPRGWHHWSYIGAEVAIPDPILTHHGITLRAGVDVAEAFDFLTGFFLYDFRRDDRRDGE